MPSKLPQFTIAVSDEMFKDIEDFRYDYHFKSRNDAINALIKRGMETMTPEIARQMSLSTHSKSYQSLYDSKKPHSDE